MNDGNRVVVVDNMKTLTTFWKFFTSAYPTLVKRDKINLQISLDDLRKVLLGIVHTLNPTAGHVVVLVSPRNAWLGFAICVEVASLAYLDMAEVYCCYTTGECPSTEKELYFEAEKWAKRSGFKQLVVRYHHTTSHARARIKSRFEHEQTGLFFVKNL